MNFNIVSDEQIKKWNLLLQIVECLFNNSNEEVSVLSGEIKDAWLIGDSLRDMLILSNPQISSHYFYFQVEKKNSIFNWLARLNENNIAIHLKPEIDAMYREKVEQVIVISLLEFEIDSEITIITGKQSPIDFINSVMPINLNLVGLDISKIYAEDFVLSQQLDHSGLTNLINKCVWKSEKFITGYKNKKIQILNKPWVKDVNNFNYLEQYLQKTYIKLDDFVSN